MTDSNLPNILTLTDVAEYLKVDKEIILAELDKGNLRGFKLGQDWRFTDESILAFINRNHPSPSSTQSDAPEMRYETTGLTKIEHFDYQWPKNKEHFENGYETTRTINGRSYTFRIGFTDRAAAGQIRRRIVVWLDNWPIVEFAASNNYESDSLLASIIKTPNGKQLRLSSKVPEEYKGFNIARYDSIVQGPYASKNMAVIVTKDDLEAMLHHAIIRATWKHLI